MLQKINSISEYRERLADYAKTFGPLKLKKAMNFTKPGYYKATYLPTFGLSLVYVISIQHYERFVK